MRLRKRDFDARINGNLQFEFSDERLTSNAGLELFRQFIKALELPAALRSVGHRFDIGGDFTFCKVVLTVVALLLTGAKRVRHLEFVRTDPLFRRFVGVHRLPTARSLSRSLSRISWRTWPELDRMALLVARSSLKQLDTRRWTLDIDGTILTTGLQVERAQRGFNPHRRKNPSYYPILATLAQTGHVIGHRNRRGNVHDSHQSAAFLRHSVEQMRGELELDGTLEVRTDSAFFKRDFLETCDRLKLEYAIKVPVWPWLNIKGVVKKQPKESWQWVSQKLQIQGLFVELPINAWERTERVAIYRRRVNHKPTKGRQLELFNPDDGDWEYSVVATNKTLGLAALWHFQAGRGVQEKTIAELKSGYAFDSIPTQNYRANTVWQKLNILTHNLVTTLQLGCRPMARPLTHKRTGLFRLSSIATIRFEWLNCAARLVAPGGKLTLRLPKNSSVEGRFQRVLQAIADAA